ncbi:MAG: thioredoxin [Bacilli bacterium]|nr:thioredoxin [Bacilli bacterium]
MEYIKSVSEFNELIQNEKVLVDFYAEWCGPCQMLGKVLEEVDKERDDIKIVKVNTDDFLSLAKDFKIMSIPAVKVFENGKVIKEKVGFMTKNELLEFIDN